MISWRLFLKAIQAKWEIATKTIMKLILEAAEHPWKQNGPAVRQWTENQEAWGLSPALLLTFLMSLGEKMPPLSPPHVSLQKARLNDHRGSSGLRKAKMYYTDGRKRHTAPRWKHFRTHRLGPSHQPIVIINHALARHLTDITAKH